MLRIVRRRRRLLLTVITPEEGPVSGCFRQRANVWNGVRQETGVIGVEAGRLPLIPVG